jgi:hypothetical protein
VHDHNLAERFARTMLRTHSHVDDVVRECELTREELVAWLRGSSVARSTPSPRVEWLIAFCAGEHIEQLFAKERRIARWVLARASEPAAKRRKVVAAATASSKAGSRMADEKRLRGHKDRLVVRNGTHGREESAAAEDGEEDEESEDEEEGEVDEKGEGDEKDEDEAEEVSGRARAKGARPPAALHPTRAEALEVNKQRMSEQLDIPLDKLEAILARRRSCTKAEMHKIRLWLETRRREQEARGDAAVSKPGAESAAAPSAPRQRQFLARRRVWPLVPPAVCAMLNVSDRVLMRKDGRAVTARVLARRGSEVLVGKRDGEQTWFDCSLGTRSFRLELKPAALGQCLCARGSSAAAASAKQGLGLKPRFRYNQCVSCFQCPLHCLCELPIMRNGLAAADIDIGALVDALDTENVWYGAIVRRIDDRRMLVHYQQWSSAFDEWIAIDSPRLARFRTRSTSSSPVAAAPVGTRSSMDGDARGDCEGAALDHVGATEREENEAHNFEPEAAAASAAMCADEEPKLREGEAQSLAEAERERASADGVEIESYPKREQVEQEETRDGASDSVTLGARPAQNETSEPMRAALVSAANGGEGERKQRHSHEQERGQSISRSGAGEDEQDGAFEDGEEALEEEEEEEEEEEKDGAEEVNGQVVVDEEDEEEDEDEDLEELVLPREVRTRSGRKATLFAFRCEDGFAGDSGRRSRPPRSRARHDERTSSGTPSPLSDFSDPHKAPPGEAAAAKGANGDEFAAAVGAVAALPSSKAHSESSGNAERAAASSAS